MQLVTDKQFEQDLKEIMPVVEDISPKQKADKLFEVFTNSCDGQENAKKAVIISAKHGIRQSKSLGRSGGYDIKFWKLVLKEAELL